MYKNNRFVGTADEQAAHWVTVQQSESGLYWRDGSGLRMNLIQEMAGCENQPERSSKFTGVVEGSDDSGVVDVVKDENGVVCGLVGIDGEVYDRHQPSDDDACNDHVLIINTVFTTNIYALTPEESLQWCPSCDSWF